MRMPGKIAATVAALLLLSGLSAGAQKLVSLPKASDTVTGTLPNGISYYVVTNPICKGYADFALVQKGPVEKSLSRELLSSLPNFQKDKPYEFLARRGIGYSEDGFVSYSDSCTIFRLSGVHTDDTAVTDTTLLMLFGLSGRYPYEQALVICGDVKASQIQERMNVFSMMVTPRGKAPGSREPAWRPSGEMVLTHSETDGETAFSISYSSPRTPQDVMPTVQPAVTKLFASELGFIIKHRVGQCFRLRGIPLGGMEWTYRSSADSPLCEKYTLTIKTLPSQLEKAVEACANIFADLDQNGASTSEYTLARELFAIEPVSDEQRCISAFLYSSSLASNEDEDKYLRSRKISAEREAPFFNSFISALLGPSANLEFSLVSPSSGSPSAESLGNLFSSSWLKSSAKTSFHNAAADSTKLSGSSVKVKLKASAAEPVTGGQMWTFSNGMKVIFKQSGSERSFRYCLLLNGGYSDVKNLRKGEGGFVQDMFSLYNISGMESSTFRAMLEANRVSMSCEVTESDLRLSGEAPSDRMQLVLKSLVAAASERKLDKKAFPAFRNDAAARLPWERKERAALAGLLDSLLTPDYKYTATRSLAALGEDLPQRADEYFNARFSSCSDGVLILVGNLDEFELKKQLQRYLGGFETSHRHSVRPQISLTPLTSTLTFTDWAPMMKVGDGRESVNMAISSSVPFSQEKNYSFRIALKILEDRIIAAMPELGMAASVTGRYELFPTERMVVHLSLRKVPEAGLPEGVISEDPLVAISEIRSLLADIGTTQISDSEIKFYKAWLGNELDRERTSREGIVEAAILRYSLGKDVASKYQDKLKSVNASSVKQVLSAISAGGRVEYIIY
jgi:hypothetical protein